MRHVCIFILKSCRAAVFVSLGGVKETMKNITYLLRRKSMATIYIEARKYEQYQ